MSEEKRMLIQAINYGVEANSRAEAAEKELAALKEAARWVPVGERLPNVDSKTEISKDLILECDIVDDPIRKGYYDRCMEKWYLSDTRFSTEVIVKRWRELPQPPEEGDHA